MIDIVSQMICVLSVFVILYCIISTFGNENIHAAARVAIVILGLIAGYLIISGAMSVHDIALGVTKQMQAVPSL